MQQGKKHVDPDCRAINHGFRGPTSFNPTQNQNHEDELIDTPDKPFGRVESGVNALPPAKRKYQRLNPLLKKPLLRPGDKVLQVHGHRHACSVILMDSRSSRQDRVFTQGPEAKTLVLKAQDQRIKTWCEDFLS